LRLLPTYRAGNILSPTATGAGSDQPAKNRKIGSKYYELFGAKVLSGLAFMLLGEVITNLVYSVAASSH
jgi:hypothetical protein